MTTSSDSADPAVSRFLDAVWMERGLSPNTLAAYRADLTALARWLAERSVPIMRTSRVDLQEFIASRVRGGARPRSTAAPFTRSSAWRMESSQRSNTSETTSGDTN